MLSDKYHVYVYHNRQKRLFQANVDNILRYARYLDKQKIIWDYILIFNKRTRQPLCFYKYGDFIHPKPTPINRGRIKQGW